MFQYKSVKNIDTGLNTTLCAVNYHRALNIQLYITLVYEHTGPSATRYRLIFEAASC